MIRILLADNQSIFRAGMARVLATQQDFTLFGQCGNADELHPLIASTRGGILLLAWSIGADLHRILAAATVAGTRTILLTEDSGEPDPAFVRRLDGLLSRHASVEEMLRCIRSVSAGERCIKPVPAGPDDSVGRRIRDSLTARELQIVGYVVQGWKNRQIAEEIGTKEQVVKNYLRSIYDKTGASDRLELALFTLHHRLLAEAAAKATAPAGFSPE